MDAALTVVHTGVIHPEGRACKHRYTIIYSLKLKYQKSPLSGNPFLMTFSLPTCSLTYH